MLRRHKEGDREGGFTLIELMVVVLIIGILLAIAIPTFIGARSRAQNKSAQSSLRNTLTAAKTIFTDANTYAGIDTSAMTSAEPALTFYAAGTASTGPKIVSIAAVSATTWAAAALSDSGACYYIKDITTGSSSAVTYGKDDSSPVCTGTQGDTSAATAGNFP